MDKANFAQKHPEHYVDWLSGKYTDCKQEGGEEIVSKEVKVCDEYKSLKEKSCSIGRSIQVEAKHKYECIKERKHYRKNCEQKLRLKCKKNTECDSGGIVLSSMESDMEWSYQYPILTLGTIAQRFYWSGHCSKYTRNIKFEVKNKDAIEKFELYQAGFNRFIRISLNDTQIYNGPSGGSKLEIERGLVNTGDGFYPCGTDTKSQTIDVSADLKPFLREGSNEILMEVIVTGGIGGGWFRIRTKQHCCNEWEESWEDNCE